MWAWLVAGAWPASGAWPGPQSLQGIGGGALTDVSSAGDNECVACDGDVPWPRECSVWGRVAQGGWCRLRERDLAGEAERHRNYLEGPCCGGWYPRLPGLVPQTAGETYWKEMLKRISPTSLWADTSFPQEGKVKSASEYSPPSALSRLLSSLPESDWPRGPSFLLLFLFLFFFFLIH